MLISPYINYNQHEQILGSCLIPFQFRLPVVEISRCEDKEKWIWSASDWTRD